MHKLAAFLLCLPVVVFAGEWQLEDTEIDFEAVTSLRQSSATTIKNEYATKDVTPEMAFLCRPGDPHITAQIDWQRFISSFSTEVGFKIDGGKFKWLKWKIDRSEKVTLSPSSADTQTLIELLGGGSQLLVEISPYSDGPVTAEFDLTGFGDAMQAFRARCR